MPCIEKLRQTGSLHVVGEEPGSNLLQAPKVGGRTGWGTLVHCYEPITIDRRSRLERGSPETKPR